MCKDRILLSVTINRPVRPRFHIEQGSLQKEECSKLHPMPSMNCSLPERAVGQSQNGAHPIALSTGTQHSTGAMNNPILIQSPPVITVVKGLTVQLWCAMYDACVSTTNVYWYQQRPGTESTWVISLQPTPIWKRGFPHRFWPSREVARNIYLLTIRDVQPSDTALYTCGVRGAYPEAGTRLNVTSAPVIIQSPSLERVTEGQTARLQCTIQKATVRDTDVHWYRQLPGQDMEWVLTHDVMNNTRGGPGFTDRFQPSRDIANNSFILTITNVQPSDTAVYYCKVWGDISGNGTQLNITTSSGTAGDQDTTADYENISCARDTRNSGDRPADSNATYMALQRPDQSIYSDLKGAVNDPILIQSPPVITVVKGLTVQLWCAMYDACVSTTNVHWYQQRPGTKSTWVISLQPTPIWKRGFPHRFWPSREVARNIYLLTIRDVQPSDTALYTCSVWGRVSGAGTRLNVTSAPVIIQSPSLERVTEGQTARLQCTIQKATVRDTDVHWYRQLPGQDMEWVLTHDVMNNTRGGPGFTDRFQPSRDIANNSFILTITNVQPSDTAVYYCKVWGDISGNGTQLNITKQSSSHEMVWSSKVIGAVTGSLLGLLILICVLVAIFYIRPWICFTSTAKPDGAPDAEPEAIYSNVDAPTWAPTEPAPPTESGEGEIYYTELQLPRQGTSQPTVRGTESNTVYAAVRYA
ncbi:uncharacterized protein [Heptranchias perlo]|uniref:uncharacterized protein isoform X2 n=1 Tax=Heptranchias perlo TaxID=212740 RepID=UPI00355A7D8E